MKRLKILLVDDNREFLEVAAHFLTGHPGLEIVGLAQSGHAAMELVGALAPDLVIMDMSMPEMNGLVATRRIKARPQPPLVVVLTLYDGPEFAALARAAGADDFLTKSEFGDWLLPLIQRLFPYLKAEPFMNALETSGAVARTS